MNVEIGRKNIIQFCFGNNEAAQFHFWEYIYPNLALYLDFHWPFIYRVYVLGLRTDVEGGADRSELI